MDRPWGAGGRRGKRGKGKSKRSRVPTQQTTARYDFFDPTHRKPTADESGGYDYEFVDNPPDELMCPICLSVLRYPNLTSCCGNHFCHSCIHRIKSEQNPCPLCQEKRYTIMLDKSFMRRVKELKIKCPSSGHLCEWMGELGSLQIHLDVSCRFVEVTCDYCQSEDILRHDLPDHLEHICPLRPYSCEYCGLRDKWETIMSHLIVCAKHPMDCPNKCGIGGIQREDIDKHVGEECPLGEVGCKFEYAGCHVRLPRKDIGQHLSENVSSHLEMVLMTFQEKLTEKDDVIDELRANIESQRREIAALKMSAESQSKNVLALTTNVQSQGKDISELRGKVQSQYRRTEELKVRAESQDVLALAANVQSQGKDISKLRGNVQSLYRRTEELKVSAESQSKDVLALAANVQSQGKDISELRGKVQSQYRHTEELKVRAESRNRVQNRHALQIAELEATVQLHTRTLEKVCNEAGDLQSIFYVQLFQLLKDIASRNRDIHILDTKRTAEAAMLGTIGGAALGMTAGRVMGPAAQFLGSIVGGSIGALAGFASSEPQTVVNLLSKMNEEEQRVMAASAIIVAYECDFDIVEQLFAKAILCNPRQARSFLVAVLRKQNIAVR